MTFLWSPFNRRSSITFDVNRNLLTRSLKNIYSLSSLFFLTDTFLSLILSNLQHECQTQATQMQHECNTSDTSATQVRHKQQGCNTSATQVLYEWHECGMSATRTTRVRHEWKILILITIRVKTYFHTLIFTIGKWNTTRRGTILY